MLDAVYPLGGIPKGERMALATGFKFRGTGPDLLILHEETKESMKFTIPRL
jgi:hypothetical protein